MSSLRQPAKIPHRDDVYVVAVFEDNQTSKDANDRLKVYGLLKNDATHALVETMSKPHTRESEYNIGMDSFDKSFANFYLPKNGNLIFQPAFQDWYNYGKYDPKMWVQYNTMAYHNKGQQGGQPHGQPYRIKRDISMRTTEALAPDAERFVDDTHMTYYNEALNATMRCQIKAADGGMTYFEFCQSGNEISGPKPLAVNHPDMNVSWMNINGSISAKRRISADDEEEKFHTLDQQECSALYDILEKKKVMKSGDDKYAYFGIDAPPAVQFSKNIAGLFKFDAVLGFKEKKIHVPANEIF